MHEMSAIVPQTRLTGFDETDIARYQEFAFSMRVMDPMQAEGETAPAAKGRERGYQSGGLHRFRSCRAFAQATT